MSTRRRAREVAFQVLYQDDLNPRGNPAERDQFIRRRLQGELTEFARDLVAGVRRHRAELDETLAAKAEHWSIHRMAATDRNILRLGAYEILRTDVPDRVAIDEAVELAKRFGTQKSARFVNGLLDRVMHGREPAEPGPSPATS